MLASGNMDADQVAKAIRQYNQRLEVARRTSRKYYHTHQAKVNAKRVVESIKRGRTPTKASVEKYDRVAITNAWLEFVQNKTKLNPSGPARRARISPMCRQWTDLNRRMRFVTGHGPRPALARESAGFSP